MLTVLFKPKAFFEELNKREFSIATPILILFLVGIFDGVVNTLAVEHQTLGNVLSGAFPLTKFLFLVISSNLSFYLLIAAQTFLFHLIIIKLGGKGGSRKHSFYILGLAALPILIQSIVHLLFPGTVWWQNFDPNGILYFLSYSLLNFFSIWGVVILVVGFAKVYDVSYKVASILYLQFLLKIIPLVIIMLLSQ